MIWLFLDGTLLWVFVLLVSLALFGTVQSESPGWCSFIFGATVVALQLFSPYHPLTFWWHHPFETLAAVAGYALAGTFWCVVKWTSHVHLLKDRYLDYKNDYALQNKGQTSYPYIDADKYAATKLGVALPTNDAERSAFLREHKGSIYMWIAFWPFSLIGTIFDDPVRRFLRFVYSRLSGTLSGITERAFKDI